ncbi:uncharacterized protein MYCFIDRAFT_178986 [Pseudocercospora fijiensis CIRAD86]|uniref:Uncharacterized protein n=1 Tax=Pseudocercospora fijiensis (strain CIRAD86) TaxID=383855 RepID=M3A2Y5_PSEFD|nr:uncharacterized protein MYCFIDRAFT_178986 [Pseudocercospora fijiensis CIRAD86]EME78901.1 hypothetical protein MYCFIDRAFT_178986 [Pseudocercospora fijiensis CIRAD86]
MVRDFTKVNLDNSNPQIASDLMGKLPAEIRNQIWDLVLESAPVFIRSNRFARPTPPGILLSCKQAYYEAIKLHWSNSSFCVSIPKPECWFTRIGRRRRKLLKNVRVGTDKFVLPAVQTSAAGSRTIFGLLDQLDDAKKLLEQCQAGRRDVAPGDPVRNTPMYGEPVNIFWTAYPDETAQGRMEKQRAFTDVFQKCSTIAMTCALDDGQWEPSSDVIGRYSVSSNSQNRKKNSNLSISGSEASHKIYLQRSFQNYNQVSTGAWYWRSWEEERVDLRCDRGEFDVAAEVSVWTAAEPEEMRRPYLKAWVYLWTASPPYWNREGGKVADGRSQLLIGFWTLGADENYLFQGRVMLDAHLASRRSETPDLAIMLNECFLFALVPAFSCKAPWLARSVAAAVSQSQAASSEVGSEKVPVKLHFEGRACRSDAFQPFFESWKKTSTSTIDLASIKHNPTHRPLRAKSAAVAVMWNLADFTRVDLGNASLQEDSPLMQKLPPELRHRIYGLALDDTVTVNIGVRPNDIHKEGLPAAPPLMLSCKQVYAEAIKLYWCNSTFRFPHATSKRFVTWSSNICRRRRELLSNVEIHNMSRFMTPEYNLDIGSKWMDQIWKKMAASGERTLEECQAGRRGIAAGVIKTNLLLPSSKAIDLLGHRYSMLGHRYHTIAQEIWTANPKETVIMTGLHGDDGPHSGTHAKGEYENESTRRAKGFVRMREGLEAPHFWDWLGRGGWSRLRFSTAVFLAMHFRRLKSPGDSDIKDHSHFDDKKRIKVALFTCTCSSSIEACLPPSKRLLTREIREVLCRSVTALPWSAKGDGLTTNIVLVRDMRRWMMPQCSLCCFHSSYKTPRKAGDVAQCFLPSGIIEARSSFNPFHT